MPSLWEPEFAWVSRIVSPPGAHSDQIDAKRRVARRRVATKRAHKRRERLAVEVLGYSRRYVANMPWHVRERPLRDPIDLTDRKVEESRRRRQFRDELEEAGREIAEEIEEVMGR